ncbi:MAG: type II toxin-antitoxin system PemK/MazF family toxin [Planctomycetota bacterium]|nr:type II toxin-antitoxin system PemK/MazF family toxin [Planctomycetota bacterium]
MRRGDVVVVPFPFQDRPDEKIRPAVVIQSDSANNRLGNTILAMITGNLSDASQHTTLLVDPNSPEGTQTGLSGPSLVKCSNIATVRKHRVIHVIGHLSESLMQQLDDCLRSALDLR